MHVTEYICALMCVCVCVHKKRITKGQACHHIVYQACSLQQQANADIA